MSDQITVTLKTEPNSVSIGSGQQNLSLGRSQLITISAMGLGMSFFLPWAQFFAATLSGFDLRKMGGLHRLLWSIPGFCAITLLAGCMKKGQNAAARITGSLPFIAAIYWFNKIGSDLTHLLTYGAYLSMLCGVTLLILSRRSK